MDEEHELCTCGRNHEVALRAQKLVAEQASTEDAYNKALFRTVEEQPEWTDDCLFWDCVAEYGEWC